MSGGLRSALAAFEGKPLRHGIAAAVLVVLMAAGSGVAHAAWTASVTATSTASAATLTVTTSNVNSLAATLGNEAVASAGSVSLTSTGSITVSNTTTTTSTTVPALAITLSSAGGSLAALVGATIWYQANGTCTAATAVGAGSATGTWGGSVVLNSTLAKGATATYCVRSTIANRQSAAVAGGTQGFTPRVVARLTVGNFEGTATAQSSTTQATRALFPLFAPATTGWFMVKRATTSLCMDVSGGGTSASGTAVITYTCKASDFTNQEWLFTQDASTGYYDIRPRSTQTLRVDAQSGSVAVVTDGSAATQLWQLQLVAAGTYQFVNKSTGLCLVSAASSGTTAMTTAVCDNSASQRFTLTQTATTGLQNLTCVDASNSANIGANWTLADQGPYRAQARKTAGGTWYDVSASSGTWADSVQITGGTRPTGSAGVMTSWSSDTYPVRIVDGAGTVVGTFDVERYTSRWSGSYLRCA